MNGDSGDQKARECRLLKGVEIPVKQNMFCSDRYYLKGKKNGILTNMACG